MFFIGKFKSVAKIEQERQQLKDDFQVYTEIEGSKRLKDFLLLKEKVESATFKAKKKEIESLKYKGSPEEKLAKRFAKLDANANIKSYYKVLASDELKRFNKLSEYDLLKQVKELQYFLKSEKYTLEKKDFKKKSKDKTFSGTWQSTDAAKKEKEFYDLKNSSDYLFYLKYSKSKELKNFNSLDGSSLVSDYENLKKEVSSQLFKERIAYLEDKQRYLKTDDHKSLVHYNDLKNDKGIQLYFNYHGSDAFKFFREWAPTLTEDFSSKLDKSKWSFISPIAEKGPGKNFSVKDQLQCFDNDKNFEIENGILILKTHEEKKEGLYWDVNYGFLARDFNYTSGLMHSLNFFKQEYGLFEIKLKASKVKGVISSVFLVDEDENECIRMISFDHRKASGGIVYTEQGQRIVSKVNMNVASSGYIIVSVEWTPERIEWRVNDKVMGSLSQNVPHEKLGLRIETEVIKPTSNLPHRIDIDWINCYKRK
jgi:hypothetical protein